MMQNFRALQARLDQMGLELLARAANLDALAAMIDARTVALDHRERDLVMRENDVLMAGEELRRQTCHQKTC